MKKYGFILLMTLFVGGSCVVATAQIPAPQQDDRSQDLSNVIQQEELDALVKGLVDFDKDPDALNKALVELDSAKAGLTFKEYAQALFTIASLEVSLAAENIGVRMATLKKDVTALALVVNEQLKKVYAKANAHVTENKKAYIVGGSAVTAAVVLALIIYLSQHTTPAAV